VSYIITWILTALIFRYSSLAALIAALPIPIYSYFIEHNNQYTISFAVIAIILFWRHKPNIYNLLNGKEDKIW
jgi:glycerol-3-phosphate acyltransferase PlsY